MCVRASVVLMQCTLAHHVKFVRASCVNFHTLPNSNQGQLRSNLISHVFILNTNFNGHQFLVAKSALNGRNATVFALRFCGPPSWMRERVRSRIKSRPSANSGIELRLYARLVSSAWWRRRLDHAVLFKSFISVTHCPSQRNWWIVQIYGIPMPEQVGIFFRGFARLMKVSHCSSGSSLVIAMTWPQASHQPSEWCIRFAQMCRCVFTNRHKAVLLPLSDSSICSTGKTRRLQID